MQASPFTTEIDGFAVTMTFPPCRNAAAAERVRQILLTSFLDQSGAKRFSGTFAAPEDLGYNKVGNDADAP